MCSTINCNNDFIVNKKYNLCQDCNYKRLHNGKSSLETFIEQEKDKPYIITTKKKTSVTTKINRQKSKDKRKAVLVEDRLWYKWQFENKECRCEECKAQLPDEFEDEEGNINYISQYSHILSKGAYPEFRHHKLNCNKLCFNCHQRWEFSDKENMRIYPKNMQLIDVMFKERNNKNKF